MKTNVKRHGKVYLFVFWLMSVLCLLLKTQGISQCYAQDIQLKNPSLEGTPGNDQAPDYWVKCGRTPDVQPIIPTYCGVTKKASEGKTYVGMIAVGEIYEGISQELQTPFTAGRSYLFSFDVAFQASYCLTPDYGALAIYGGDSTGERAELLWSTTRISDTTWKRTTARFTVKKAWKYITITSYLKPEDIEAGKARPVYSSVLIDNLSDFITEVPTVKISVHNSCKGHHSGQAAVSVTGGIEPFLYYWDPGYLSGDSVSNLRSGRYSVTVLAANGMSVTDTFEVNDYEISADVIASAPLCFGEQTGQIDVHPSGGVAPFTFSINGGLHFWRDSVFSSLAGGVYQLVIKDHNHCEIVVPDVDLKSPAQLVADKVKVTAVACSGVSNGKVSFEVSGGTPPYAYSVSGYATEQAANVVSQLDAGEYSYKVEDSYGCMISGDFSISREWQECAVFVPNAFSPNGDGINDVFRAAVHDDVRDYHMQVYGRWGQLVFESVSPERGWDGLERGQQVPAGSYLWVVTYTDSHNQGRKQTGSLVLIR